VARALEEQRIRGVDAREAFNAAINEVVPPFDFGNDEEDDDERAEFINAINEACEATEDEPWLENGSDRDEDADDNFEDRFERMERDPLQQRAKALLFTLYAVADRGENRSRSIDMLLRNAMEITGGLSQVLPLSQSYDMGEGEAGLAFVQLKRALRGAAFVQGALFLIRSDGAIQQEEFEGLYNEAQSIATKITELIRSVRESQW
jgi:hypothetical protein